MDNPKYKFGIDNNDELSYYVNESTSQSTSSTSSSSWKKLWSATPPPPETSSCIVFGQCSTPLQFFRLQTPGSLAGYNGERVKVWDSHEHGGEYTDFATELGVGLGGGSDNTPGESNAGGIPNVISDKANGSTLELTDEGVIIYDGSGAVTWRVDAPTAADGGVSGVSFM